MAWLLSLSCSGPGPLSAQQIPLFEWIIYALFSACSHHIIQSALHLLFFSMYCLSLLTQRRLVREDERRKKSAQAISGPLFISTIVLLSLAACMSFAALGWQIWYASALSGWTEVAISEVIFSSIQALAWTVFVIVVCRELSERSPKHPHVVRAWWFISAVISILQFVSAVMRISDAGSAYAAPLRVDDVVNIVTFPVSIFLMVVSAWGRTGLKKRTEDGILEPLVNGLDERKHANVTGYYTAGAFSKLFWLWVNPLLAKGYQTTLQVEDVPELSPDDRAETLYAFFQANWPKRKTDHPVRSALLRSFKGQLLFTGAIAFIKAISMYVGPLLIQSFVNFLDSESRYYSEGYVLVLVLLIAKFIEVLSTHQYQFLSQKLGMVIRSCLITSIYKKGLKLSSSSRQSHGLGKIVNYMTVDVQQINDSIVQLHNTWMLPFQVIIALFIVYRSIGVAMFAGIATLLVLGILVTYSSRLLRYYSVQVMTKKDIRMKATAEVLNHMRSIKLQAWEYYFCRKVEDCRKAEYKCLTKFQYALASNVTVLTIATSVVSLVTFSTCLIINVELTTAKVFTVISTFNILSEPIRTFPQAVISVSQALVSLERLDKYMSSTELEGYVIRDPPPNTGCSIVVENGHFSWDDMTKKPILRDVNFIIPQGHLVAIVGTVGSGKSSLLAALLGEMPKLSGTVKVYGSTAYVPQTSWIQSGTIEENILFGMAMNRAKYQRTLKACALEQDLTLFEFGDQTEIGERGINLSGGQKQRVQLARAVYQNSDVYFLDDIFSALDAHTGSAIFKDCVLGVLKRKTRILVTHQVEFLYKADLILVLQDGIIQQAGTYRDLLEAGAEFGALIAAHKTAIGTVESESKDDALEAEELRIGTPSQFSDTFEESVRMLKRTGSEPFSSSQELKLKGSSSFLPLILKDGPGKLVEEERRETGRVGWNVYWLYLTKAFGPFFILVVLVVQVGAQSFAIIRDFWLSNATSKSSISVGGFIRMYTLLCSSNWLFIVARSILMALFSLKSTQKFYLDMLKSIFRAPMSFFDTTPSGRILTRSSTDQATMDILLPLSVMLALILYSATIGVLIVTCVVTWPVIFVILPLGWVYLHYQNFYINSSREITRLDSVTKAPIIHHFTETIAGFMVIRGFRKEEDFINTNLARVNTNLKMDFHYNASNEWLGFRLEIIGAAVLCMAAFLLVILPDGIIRPSLAALALSYGLSLNTILAASVFFSCMIENKMVAVERVGQYTRLPTEAPMVIDGCVPYEDWPGKGHISIRNLTARYQQTMPLVLKGISLDIQGGQKVGVVGRTGSGKSTLIQVLFRIVEPAGGIITFDEIDITSVGLYDLRSRLGIIPQDPVLFEGTIRTNMDPLAIHTDEEIWEGLQKCQLADIVRERTDKLDAIVVDNGENWSVGQRQLLCLGRALLKKSHILFLDEATASVDAQTDVMLQKIIRQEFQSVTVISIAHRIPTVMDCDKVMVLDAGHLKEYDSPVRLRENSITLFSALIREYKARSKG
ncbi:hypothetical protein KP509_37G046700 [Ceratopteris richardii]|uniref:Uncharacterized protein n=1 Tax=Ceratopteris richardii TaxID=49495 RepID=A0A8T2Q8B8_CERRI|nr:hypothetical protein KP509_37G046700 [Ceratopteris richardii]